MNISNKVKHIHPLPYCDSIQEALRQEAVIFLANPGLAEFTRELTQPELEDGRTGTHVLVALHSDGISHRYGTLIPWLQISEGKYE